MFMHSNTPEDEIDAHQLPQLGEDGRPEGGDEEVDDDLFGGGLEDAGDEEEDEGEPFPPAEDDLEDVRFDIDDPPLRGSVFDDLDDKKD